MNMNMVSDYADLLGKILATRLTGTVDIIPNCDGDSIQVMISNSKLNRPFLFTMFSIQDRMSNGTTAEESANIVCAAYKKFVMGFFFKN